MKATWNAIAAVVLVGGTLCGNHSANVNDDVYPGCECVEERDHHAEWTLDSNERFLHDGAERCLQQSRSPILAELEMLKLTIAGPLADRLRSPADEKGLDKICIDRIYRIPQVEGLGHRTEYLVSVALPYLGGDGWVSHIAVDQDRVEVINEFGSEAFCHATRMRAVHIGGLDAIETVFELWFVTRRGDHFVLLYSAGQSGNVVLARIVIGAVVCELPDLSYLDLDNDGIEEVIAYRTFPDNGTEVVLKWSHANRCFEELK